MTRLTVNHDTVLSGIYCVTGDIKIQSRVTGTAILLATGTISTAGSRLQLTTADPTGADLLFLAGSSDVKAISIASKEVSLKGALVAVGGINLASSDGVFDTGLVARQVDVSGNRNLLKAAQ